MKAKETEVFVAMGKEYLSKFADREQQRKAVEEQKAAEAGKAAETGAQGSGFRISRRFVRVEQSERDCS